MRSRRPLARRLTALFVLTASLLAASPASAAFPQWSGKVTRTADGDTVWVDVDGDTAGPVKVRNAGIQALELGQCNADPARVRLNQLVLGKRVRLSAEHASSSAGGRPLRFLDVVTSSGTVDVQRVLLREGLVLWENIGREDSRSATYQRAMENAAAAGRGIWDDDRCGAGPTGAARMRMWIHYDGTGGDGDDPNVEYVRVQNTGTIDLPLGNWWVREGAGRHTVRFPAGTVVRPGGYVTLHAGVGTSTFERFHFQSSTPIFGNLGSPGDVGDGIYLFDPQGDIRSHVTYPCVRDCADPSVGLVSVSAVNYDPSGPDGENVNGEYVQVTAATSAPVDLTRKVLVVGSHVLELPVGLVLAPGERLRVHSGRGTPTRLALYLGASSPLLSNSGGAVHLRNTEGTALSCRSWGSGSC